MNICVVGTGYVGLVTGACLAELGMNLICVDSDPEKIDLLKQGKNPIYEPGLEDLIRKSMKEGRLRFTTSIKEGVASSLVSSSSQQVARRFAIAVNCSPSGASNKSNGIDRTSTEASRLAASRSSRRRVMLASRDGRLPAQFK